MPSRPRNGKNIMPIKARNAIAMVLRKLASLQPD